MGRKWDELQKTAQGSVLKKQCQQWEEYTEVTAGLEAHTVPPFELNWNLVQQKCQNMYWRSWRIV